MYSNEAQRALDIARGAYEVEKRSKLGGSVLGAEDAGTRVLVLIPAP